MAVEYITLTDGKKHISMSITTGAGTTKSPNLSIGVVKYKALEKLYIKVYFVWLRLKVMNVELAKSNQFLKNMASPV